MRLDFTDEEKLALTLKAILAKIKPHPPAPDRLYPTPKTGDRPRAAVLNQKAPVHSVKIASPWGSRERGWSHIAGVVVWRSSAGVE